MPTPKKIDKERLKKLVDNKTTIKRIADIFSCSVPTIHKYIRLYNIKYVAKRDKVKIRPNMKFGLLTVIEKVGQGKNKSFLWKCLCSCGNITTVSTDNLKRGKTKSCGCFRKKPYNNWKGIDNLSGKKFAEIRYRAKRRSLNFDLTIRFLWKLWESQSGKCAISGLNIDLDKTASLDRIDSNGGYTTSNVWWVHKDVNKMKMDIPLNQFLEYCRIISSHNKEPK